MQDFRVETFLAACRTLNYTRAARELNITQPAVSQHIAFLERVYRAKLFTYANKQLSLTPAGEALREALSTMAHDERLLRERMAGLSRAARVKLSVGMTLTAGEYIAAAPLADYLLEHPECDIDIRSGDTQTLLGLLDAGAIDCAFVEGFFDRGAYASDVLTEQRLVPAAAPGYRPARRLSACVRLDDLFGERLIVREAGSGTRAVLEHALAAQNLSLDGFARVDTVESLDVIKVLVARGVGITFLYEAAAAREFAEGTLRFWELAPAVKHDIAFIRLKGSVFEGEFRRLFDFVRAALPHA